MPREFERSARVAARIQRVLGQVITSELRDPRLGLISVTDVEVTRDLSSARIFISALGDRSAADRAVEVLTGSSGLLRSRLAKALTQRQAPVLRFMPDYSQADGDRIQQLLNAAKSQNVAASDPDDSDEPADDGADATRDDR